MVVRLFLLTAFLGIFFQNCSKATLETIPSIEQIRYQRVTAKLCLDGSNQGYTIDAVAPVSLGLKPYKNGFKLDSDYDGLTDDDEETYGFDKFNSRTFGGILDSVCFQFTNSNACSNLNLKCKHIPQGFGLTDCDTELTGIDLANNHPTNGLDTDKDGILDYFELIRGTNPLVADSLADPDNDQRTNFNELLQGGNPFYYETQVALSQNPQFSARKVDDPNCQGETWEIEIKTMPWLPGKEFIKDSTFASEPSESLVLISFKLQPLDLSLKNAKVFTKVLTLDENHDIIELTFLDFDYLGEVLK